MAVAASPQDYAYSQSQRPTENWAHYCLKFVRSALGISGGADTAYHAYLASLQQGKVYTDTTPPPNVPVFWGPTSHNAAGHVALSAGDGYVWSTDIDGSGKVSKRKLDDVTKWEGGSYLGWSSSLNGKELGVVQEDTKDKKNGPSWIPGLGVNPIALVKNLGGVGGVIHDVTHPFESVTDFLNWMKTNLIRLGFYIIGLVLLVLFALRASQ